MASIRIDTTNRTSNCCNCSEPIEPGTPKIIVTGYRYYKSSHLECAGLKAENYPDKR